MSTPARRPAGTAFRTKPSEEFAAMLKGSEVWAKACERAKKEKRPVEFVLEAKPSVFDPYRLNTRTLWAWPDGTVTSPGVRREEA